MLPIRCHDTGVVSCESMGTKTSFQISGRGSKIITLHGERQVISTFGEGIICNPSRVDVSNLAPCYHEETNMRMMLDASDSVKQLRF